MQDRDIVEAPVVELTDQNEITHDDVCCHSGMTIVKDTPPNFSEIVKVFPQTNECFQRGIFFAWNNTIFNPSGATIPLEILAHEATHAIQQQRYGGAEAWWKDYLGNKGFRFEQELRAHQIEWQNVLFQNVSRAARRSYLAFLAERLSDSLYGRMTTKDNAKRLIQER